jgi:dipeptidyl aminopeptidase/acylaminoacyl peptidase
VAERGRLRLSNRPYGAGLFKAVVAVAPVTDLSMLKEERRGWTDFAVVSAYIGEGPHLHAGSPAEHADQIAVPVLLFHGANDRWESRRRRPQ